MSSFVWHVQDVLESNSHEKKKLKKKKNFLQN